MKKIELNGGLGKGKYTIVDFEDFALVSRYKWYPLISSKTYTRVYTKSRNKTIYLHRFLLNPPIDKEVDHINRNPLDNRRCNLRLATKSENNRNKPQKKNSTGYRGVTFHKGKGRINRYQAGIKVKNKYISLGYFFSAKEAAERYKEASKKSFGEFAIF
ncbi:MAG: HNH endonuclease [Candidatus Berkelbacteria bacterium]|nr:HNH endonuclease [Candidatus Berkelbacteria bacterium]